MYIILHKVKAWERIKSEKFQTLVYSPLSMAHRSYTCSERLQIRCPGLIEDSTVMNGLSWLSYWTQAHSLAVLLLHPKHQNFLLTTSNIIWKGYMSIQWNSSLWKVLSCFHVLLKRHQPIFNFHLPAVHISALDNINNSNIEWV